MPSGREAQPPAHGVLAEVARAAGVSRATVSKVVHRRDDVAPATRARVETLLADHGFVRPWERAEGPQRVLVILRDLLTPYTLEVVAGVVAAADRAGAVAVVGTTESRSVARWVELGAESRATGMILIISMLTDGDEELVRSSGLPLVLLDPLHEPSGQVPSVGVDNIAGSRGAVKHLVELGHRRIGLIAGRVHSWAGSERAEGYRLGLQDAGIPYEPSLVIATDFDFHEGVAAGLSLLRCDDPPTAVVATSDTQGLGVLEAARRLGRSVPDDLSVVSFDSTMAADTSSPPLTAVRQPFGRMGEEAVRTLTDMAAGRAPASQHRALPTELVVRSSTGHPAGHHGPDDS